MSVLDDVKVLTSDDNEAKFEVIQRLTEQRLQSILGLIDSVPQELDYIVTDVVLKRFNRISNEGVSSYSQEGESMTFQDSDFDEYANEIARYKSRLNDKSGIVRFL